MQWPSMSGKPTPGMKARSGIGSTRRFVSIVMRIVPVPATPTRAVRSYDIWMSGAQPPQQHAPVKPVAGPAFPRRRCSQMLHLVDWDSGSALGQQPVRAELALEEDHVGFAVAPDAELAAPVGAAAVVDVEAGRLEVEARGGVVVAVRAAAEVVGGRWARAQARRAGACASSTRNSSSRAKSRVSR